MPRWLNGWIGSCMAAGLLAAVGASGAVAQAGEAQGAKVELPTEQIEAIVRDYLMREPEIIYQALQELQRRETEAKAQRQKTALSDHRDALFHKASSPVGGNEDGDVTLVEFFDYHCGYCRRVVSSVRALAVRDENLRIVFKEFPILGDESVQAARAALAADRQGLYMPFHFALMGASDLSMDGIMQAAERVGLDPEKLAQDMQSPEIQAEIDDNYALAHELGIEGTPAFVIGEQLIPGAVSEERLTALIDEARTNCTTC